MTRMEQIGKQMGTGGVTEKVMAEYQKIMEKYSECTQKMVAAQTAMVQKMQQPGWAKEQEAQEGRVRLPLLETHGRPGRGRHRLDDVRRQGRGAEVQGSVQERGHLRDVRSQEAAPLLEAVPLRCTWWLPARAR
jgi:exonuclease VII small subunit